MKNEADSLKEKIRELPKVELHLHLEGAIPLPALWELVQKYGGDKEVGDINGLEEKFQYTNFSHFLETWSWKNGFLREYEDFTFIAGSVAEDLASQNIRYVEAFYSPGDFAEYRLEIQRVTEAIRSGLRAHEDRTTVNLIADLVRNYGPDRGMRWLHEISEIQELGVIGIGIGGSEQEFPPEPYEKVYAQARQYGFRTSAHAGEAAGAESIWGAIRALKVDRIGHGTRAIEDPKLMSYLLAKQLPIEACPISNLRTGVVPSLKEHPIKKLYQDGFLVSVNTDDPKMFNTSLEAEYTALVETLDFKWMDIVRLVENAIRSAWCDETTKNKLSEELRKHRSS
jgi:adenosine deaminase